MQTERIDRTGTKRTRLTRRTIPASMGALFLVLASFAVFAVACGEDPTATPAPTATVAPEPTATTPPEPTATAVPEPTATTPPEPTATRPPEPTATTPPEPTATRAPEPTPTAAPEPEPADNDLTMAFVQQALDFYEENGLDATAGHYNDAASMESGRALFLVAHDGLDVLAAPLEGSLLGPAVGTLYEPLIRQASELASEEGAWYELQGINAVTGLAELQRAFIIERDGLVFWAAHSILLENVENTTKEYVSKAIARYDAEGLEATIAYHNSSESVDGQFYLFLIGADDIYLAHPLFAHLIGTDIKDVVGSDGYELGKDIAKATEEGIWVEYLWPHPVTRREQQKVTWAVRHDGLIFASGYYAGESEVGSREWLEADPREYTMGFVRRAIERYDSDGLDSMLNYYNSVASFEGQWYLFATDANDIYNVHPLLPHLRGTDIKDVVGSDGYELGKALAAATEEGIWVEYLWPHPVTLEETPKISYAVRHDGILFASGYYEGPANAAARTQEYVRKAIDYYKENGLEDAVARYGSEESFEGQWSLAIADENGILAVIPFLPQFTDTPLSELTALDGQEIGKEIAAATEGGLWATYVVPAPGASETVYGHVWAVRYGGLLFMSQYYDERPEVPAEAMTGDQLTAAYVQKAIAFYDRNGRDATVARYKTEASAENGRSLILLDAEESVLLVYRVIPALEGQYVGPGSTFSGLGELIGAATEEGFWTTGRGINPVTKQEEPRRFLAVLHDGLVFVAGHSALAENVEDSTKDYVNKAIAKYEKDGLEATIDYYNSQDSLDGQFYLFFIGADDNYLAHPIFPHLIGTDIKDVVGSDGQELGREIAQATEEGIWVEYLWPHPVSRKEQQKVTWAVRHDGLIFASGYYAGGPEAGAPPWQDADPEEYTVDYVERAIERYQRDGLESMLHYYNSVASFEGEWYLFATDANDLYHVHPLLSHLIGTDIKDVVGSDGYELGKELAKAADGEGVWVEYLWPHPVTLKEVPKAGYAVRQDGMLFASGYYPKPDNPAAETKAYVQKAIEYYRANGLEATIAQYNSRESVDGQWSLTLADGQDIVLTAILAPNLIGTDLKDVGAGGTRQVGKEMAAATEEGRWVSHIFPNTRSSETLYAHTWAIRYDGLLFTSRYYDDQPGDPAEPAAPDGGAMTRAYVQQAIDYYEANGLDATVALYNDIKSVEGERSLIILTGDDQTVLASAIYDQLVGSNSFTGPGTPLGTSISKATPDGYWISDIILANPVTGQQGSTRFLVVRHDDLIFGAPHFIVRKDYAKDYVRRAIALYEREGLDAAIAFYDSPASLDGEFYLFLIGADDIYLAHPILPHLKGTDIKAVTDSSGYALGVEIAKATAEGHWVEYLWPNPVTRIEEPKSAWVVRHDGLIFASGYYTPDPDAAPAWKDADPKEYTVKYVEKAIARYDAEGLEALQSYYNSVGSFEGQWYLFATNADDVYVLHPLFSRLIGTDIKNLATKDSEGNPLGESLAAARDGEEGIWVEYPWPHPFTLQEVPKVAYAVRHKGLLFASGYYPEVEDPRAYTEQFVADAVARYKRDGREATIAYYNSPESVDGQWLLMMVNEQDGTILANAVFPQSVGAVIPGVGQLGITEEGTWFPPYAADNPLAPEKNRKQDWYVLHDGVIFASGYHFSDAGAPNPPQRRTATP